MWSKGNDSKVWFSLKVSHSHCDINQEIYKLTGKIAIFIIFLLGDRGNMYVQVCIKTVSLCSWAWSSIFNLIFFYFTFRAFMRPRTGAELFLLVLLFLLAKFNKFLQLTINLELRSYIKHLGYRQKKLTQLWIILNVH